jgi:hypothetical protein
LPASPNYWLKLEPERGKITPVNFGMKTLTRFSLIYCIAIAATSVRAVQVTFQVNMSAQIALGNFDPLSDSVVVAGSPLNNWSTSASPLSSSATDSNIFVGTFDISGTQGSGVQYKYVMNTAAGLVWEGQVGTGGTTGNRTFSLPAGSEVLPVVYFNNVTNSTSVTNQITFQVDMSVQVALGNFDPASGTLYLAGEFNNWNATATALTNSAANTNLWVTSLSLSGANGAAVNYKYVMNGTWEGNVGPAGAQNRSLSLAKTNQVLPIVYFNNLATVPVPTALVFEVNMAAQAALGNFDPSIDTVEARGTFNNWSGGFGLTNSPDAPYLFSGTWVDSTDPVGTGVAYQFVINGSTWETAVGNRMYTITSTNEQTVPLVFFNNVNDLGPVSVTTANGQTAVAWTAGPLIRLQSVASLVNPAWQDVPNTQGSNSFTVPPGSTPQFFRLRGP